MPNWGIILAGTWLVAFSLAVPGLGQEKASSCITCHAALTGNLADPVEKLKKSVHASARISCEGCHGGDPTTTDMARAMTREKGFVGRPAPRDIPGLCGLCHADVKRMRPYNIRTDQLTEYRISQHGQRLFNKGDTKVATCISCHGTHEIRKRDDPLSMVYHTRVPETCARCHANKEYMKGYNIPTDQHEEYRRSYHGKILAGEIKGKNPALAPNCASCHGIHGASPPGVAEVVNVCGNCHSTTASYFGESPHFLAVQRVGLPRCIDCHGNHRIEFPTVDILAGKEAGQCGSCHSPGSPGYERAQQLYASFNGALQAIRQGEVNLQTIEGAGMNVDELREHLETARTKLVEAGPISHTLNVEKVEKLTTEAKEQVTKLVAKGEKVQADLKRRRQAFSILIVLIGVIVGLIYFKRKGLKRELKEKRD